MRLTLNLVPASSWTNNVRAIVSQTQWDTIKRIVYSKAWNVCEICNGIGPKHPVECHEIWSFDDKNLIQKLDGMIALCPSCHGVKHFGLSEILGKRDKTLKHFMKINKIKKVEAEKYIEDEFRIWNERSQKQWKLDLSYLLEYGIEVKNK